MLNPLGNSIKIKTVVCGRTMIENLKKITIFKALFYTGSVPVFVFIVLSLMTIALKFTLNKNYYSIINEINSVVRLTSQERQMLASRLSIVPSAISHELYILWKYITISLFSIIFIPYYFCSFIVYRYEKSYLMDEYQNYEKNCQKINSQFVVIIIAYAAYLAYCIYAYYTTSYTEVLERIINVPKWIPFISNIDYSYFE